MFRCSECGSEYKTKPDFCDCGNDVFEEIYPTITETLEPRKSLNKSDLLSWVIFWICIIVSLFVLVYFPKIDPIPQTEHQNVKNEQKKDIPDINTFWFDSPPKPVEEDIKPVEQIKEVLNVFKPSVSDKKNMEPSKPQKVQQPKPQQSKPTQKTVKKIQPVLNQTKPATVNQTKPKPQTQQAATSNIEILNYKNGLMNRFLSNIPFSQIEGEGTCCLEFSVDGNGKLINRKFASQSDNKSVNDAAYKMMMRTPTYNPPPSSYKGEKFRLMLFLSSTKYKIYFVQ